jgi:hypothetical protein
LFQKERHFLLRLRNYLDLLKGNAQIYSTVTE